MTKLHSFVAFVLTLFWNVDLAYSACGVDDSFQPFGQKAYKVQPSSAHQATHKATCEATDPGKYFNATKPKPVAFSNIMHLRVPSKTLTQDLKVKKGN